MLGSMSSRTGGELRSALLENAAELAPLEFQWRRLAEERANIFLTPEWFSTWLRHYDEYAPAVPVVTRGDSLLGLVPLVRVRRGRPRRIQFAGANAGDYFHPVAAESDEGAVAGAAARALALGRRGYNTLVLENVDPDAAWWTELAHESPRSITAKRVKGSVLPYTDLTGLSWDEFLAGRSRNFRRDLRRKSTRLQESHRVEFRRTETHAELERDLETLWRLHDLRWADRDEDSAAAEPRLRRFLADLAAVTLEQGWLRLWILELDGEPVAARLEWLFGTRLASYYTGFDPKLDREGVGFVLVAHTLRAAIEEGAREYNMLLGSEQWKTRFATGELPVTTVALVPSAHPARLLVSAETGMRRGLDGLSPGARRRARGIARPLRALLPTARR
jgi:CelD/BcsL family acetyltransferase involved in cellulose biosynthesis